MVDLATQDKWNKAAASLDLMTGTGELKRWLPFKSALFSHMQPGNILFASLGTGLDIPAFPPGMTITAIDISPEMLKRAQPRINDYDGEIQAELVDVHELPYPDNHFDQVFTSCTFCSVPNPVAALQALNRVLKPGGSLCMFEHTGSRYFPFKYMLDFMTIITSKIGPDMNRNTVGNVRAAGFEVTEVNNLFLDIVKTIKAIKPIN
ncbi:MAG: methyltransferase domain-containing protein [Gammaproteobacteria bacterium]|nr:methyltransferase domain-containing protein [Gammaproteobacteria bacterium]